MSSSLISKENLSSKRRISLVALGENCGKNHGTEITEVKSDPLSSRKSLRLQGPSGISLSPEILKTSEENFGKNPGDEQTAKVRLIHTSGTFHYAKLTGQKSVGIPEGNGTTFSD